MDTFDHHPRLPEAGRLAREAAAELARLGFGPSGVDLTGAKGAFDEVWARIEQWQPGRAPVVLYWTGHGQQLRMDGLHLLCRDTPAPLQVTGLTRAVRAAHLGAAIARKRIPNAIVLIDACYAGGGALEIIEGYDAALRELGGRDAQAMEISVITSAREDQRAVEGVFPAAVRKAVSAKFDPLSARISPEEFAQAIQDAYDSAEVRNQRVGFKKSGVGRPDAHKVFRNPAYRPDSPPVQMELREGAEHRIEDDLDDHFLLKFRGLEVLGDQGWFFSGRRETLHRIGRFLDHPGPGVFVLTGPPGSGKSAVLGRLAVLSNPRTREAARQAGALDEQGAVRWPQRPITGGLHARGLTFAACVSGLARALGADTADVRDLTAEIARRTTAGERVTLMLDALDEAQPADILRIVTDLLRPAVATGAKVLVGTRRSAVREGTWPRVNVLLERLIAEAHFQAWDLEKDPAGQDDVAAYITKRLRTAPTSPYRDADDPEKGRAEAAEAGRILAGRCGGVFLPARVFCHVLIHQPYMLDLERQENLDLFSTDIKEAFDTDLQRFGTDERWVRDRLRTLAWAEGNGLPAAGVWPAVAEALLVPPPGTVLAGPPAGVDDAEIERLIRLAAPYLIEATESGQPVYRLYHEQFIGYLRGDDDPAERQNRITEALLALAGEKGDRDWERVNPYLIRHLPAHAAQAGLLPGLLADPGFLVHADPDRITAVIKQTEFVFDDQPLARLYDRLADRMAALDPAGRAELLQTGAGQYEPEALTKLRGLPGLLWSGITSIAEPQPFYRSFEGHTEPVTELAVVPAGGQTLLVTGSRSILHVWDVKTSSRKQTVPRPRALDGRAIVGLHGAEPVLAVAVGRRIRMLPLTGNRELNSVDFPQPVSAMALHRTTDGRDLLAVAEHTLITVVDLGRDVRTSVTYGKPVELLAWTDLDGEPVLAGSGGGDFWLWPLDGAAQPAAVHTSSQPIWSMAVTADASGVLCAWSRTHGDIEVMTAERVDGEPDNGPDGSGLAWRTGGVRVLRGHRQVVGALAFAGLYGRQALVSGSEDRTARLWDVATGSHRVLQSATHVETVAAAVFEGRIVVATGDRGAGVRLWNPAPDADTDTDTDTDNSTGTGTGTGTGLAPASRDTAAAPVRAVAVAPHIGSLAGLGPDPDPDDDITVVFGTEDGTVQIRHGDGTLLYEWTRDSGEVVAVATDGRRAVAGHRDGVIELYDRVTCRPTSYPGAHGGRVEALAFLPDGSWVSAGLEGAVRLWPLYGQKQITLARPGQQTPFRALATARTADGARIAAIARRRVRIWDWPGPVQGTDLTLPAEAASLRSGALAEFDDGTVLALGDTEGVIHVLPVPGRDGGGAGPAGLRAPVVCRGHTGLVHALALGTLRGRPVLASASTDRTVRMWDPADGTELNRWSAEASAEEMATAGFHLTEERLLRVLGIGRAVHVADARRAGGPEPLPQL
ncbi:hypothetical protein [Catenulispora sp. GP43]|uniref:hypothetical protein n=1 Tax=Catenulispora sp. GP43 TaxID=3156263 RepID=UPI003513CEE5